MKTEKNQSPITSNATAQFYRKMVDTIRDLRDRLLEKYEQTLPGRAYLVRKAVAEAEAMAWQTSFPHLLFPDLVEARVAALARDREYDLADAA